MIFEKQTTQASSQGRSVLFSVCARSSQCSITVITCDIILYLDLVNVDPLLLHPV